MPQQKKLNRWDYLIATTLGTIYILFLMSQLALGYSRDESFYFVFGWDNNRGFTSGEENSE